MNSKQETREAAAEKRVQCGAPAGGQGLLLSLILTAVPGFHMSLTMEVLPPGVYAHTGHNKVNPLWGFPSSTTFLLIVGIRSGHRKSHIK